MGKANFVQEGLSLDYTPATALLAGAIVALGDIVGITKLAIAAGELGALAVEGVFDIEKSGDSGPVFSEGDLVFYDTSAELAAVGGPLALGTCVADAGASDTRVRVKLIPHGIPAPLQDRLWEDVDLSGGNKVLDAVDTGKVMNVTVGSDTNVVTLPTTASGVSLRVRCGIAGERVAVSPAAADLIRGANLPGVDDKDRILTAATAKLGDYLALEADAIVGWHVIAERGIWAQES